MEIPCGIDEIREAKPGTWATVVFSDFDTFSKLSRNGLYLVDMSGEVWTMRRVGEDGIG
jgi:hypothetical protein